MAAQQNCGSFYPKMPWSFTLPHLTGSCLASTDSLWENTRDSEHKTSTQQCVSPSPLLCVLIRDNCYIVHMVHVWFCLGTTEDAFIRGDPRSWVLQQMEQEAMILIKKLHQFIIFNSCLRSLFCILLLTLFKCFVQTNHGGASLWKTMLSLVLRIPAYKGRHLATSFTPANACTTELGLLLSKIVLSLLLIHPPPKKKLAGN